MTGPVLITGASGFAGRHLAAQLVAGGAQVHGTVRTRTSGVDGLQEHVLDLTDVDHLTEVLREVRPVHLYHLAAIVDTVQTDDVLELHRVNYLGTAAVLEAVRRADVPLRVLHASSAFAYGRQAEQPVREDAPLEPVTPYGATKAAGEALVLQWGRETGREVVITRAFQHTGPGHVGAYALADWAGQLARGTERIRCGNLDVERDYLDVRDVADAYRAVMHRGRPATVYNVARGVPVAMRALLEGLIAAFGGGAVIDVDPARVRTIDQPAFYGDVTRLQEHTGWRPAYELDVTLADLAQFWRQRVHPDGA